MDVKSPSEHSVSYQWVGVYAVCIGLFTAGVIAPALVSIPYLRAIETLLLVVVFSQVVRLSLSGVLAFQKRSPPDVSLEERDLPRVSIVIPAYNEASVLPETIESCADLEYPTDKLEVVVCYEANCIDATPAIAEAAAEEYAFVEAIERDEPGGGKAAAANYAIRHASGEVIASIDADQRFESDAVGRAVKWFVADPDIWCLKGRCFGRNPTDSLISLYATVDRHINEKADLFAREVFSGFTTFGGGQAFFRASVFTEIGEFDESVLTEDIDMSVKIHKSGKRLHIDPEVITYEEQPTTVRAWWEQRKRWARGWLQVSVEYLSNDPLPRILSRRQKIDGVYTFGYNVLLPFLVGGMPLPIFKGIYTTVFGVTNQQMTAYIPYSQLIWTIMGVFPVLVAVCVFAQDRRDGLAHHQYEYIAAVTVGAYFAINSVIYAVAFLEEFVFKRPAVYVTTARANESDRDENENERICGYENE